MPDKIFLVWQMAENGITKIKDTINSINFYQFQKKMGLVGKELAPFHPLLHKLADSSPGILLDLEHRKGGGFPSILKSWC